MSNGTKLYKVELDCVPLLHLNQLLKVACDTLDAWKKKKTEIIGQPTEAADVYRESSKWHASSTESCVLFG